MQYITLLFQLLPLAIQLVGAVEGLLPDGNGAAKLKMVKDALTAVNSSVDTVWPVIEKVIASTVATMNTVKAVAK